MKRPTSLILIVIAIALFYTFTRPQYDRVKELNVVVSDYTTVLDNISHISETRDRLISSYEAIPKSEIDRLKKFLPDNIDSVRLALDLDTIAGRYGISIKDVKVETEPRLDSALIAVIDESIPYKKATVTFSFVSNYENFILLLNDLEKSLRVIDIKSASFHPGEEELYEHNISFDTYWLK